MPPQQLHIVISVSVPCQPVWIPSLKSWCRDNRAPLFWISLSSSFHPTLLLCVSKTRFLMPTGSDGREQVSLVSSYAKKKKKSTIMIIHNDNDLAAPQMLDMLWNGPCCAWLYGYAEEEMNTLKGDVSKPYPWLHQCQISGNELLRAHLSPAEHSMQLHMCI